MYQLATMTDLLEVVIPCGVEEVGYFKLVTDLVSQTV